MYACQIAFDITAELILEDERISLHPLLQENVTNLASYN